MREDTYQGKVGLVMKIGASAFTDEPDVKEPGYGGCGRHCYRW